MRQASKLVSGFSLCHCLHIAEAPGCTLQGIFLSITIFSLLVQFSNLCFHEILTKVRGKSLPGKHGKNGPSPSRLSATHAVKNSSHHSYKKKKKKKLLYSGKQREHLFAAYSFCIMLMSDSIRLFWCLLWRTFVKLCRAAQSKSASEKQSCF